jgi:hypothetical protein
LQLRTATVDDAEQLVSLLKDIGWFEASEGDIAEEPSQRVKAQLALTLADDSHAVYVAEDGAAIIGYISVHWIPYLFMRGPEGYVSELLCVMRRAGKESGAVCSSGLKRKRAGAAARAYH